MELRKETNKISSILRTTPLSVKKSRVQVKDEEVEVLNFDSYDNFGDEDGSGETVPLDEATVPLEDETVSLMDETSVIEKKHKSFNLKSEIKIKGK